MGHGPLEQARVPNEELMEPHGVSRGSRSKDTGPLELGALNQESMGLHRIPYSGPQLGLYTVVPAGISYNESRTTPQAVGLSWALRLQAPAWLSNGWFQPHQPGPQSIVTGRTFIRRAPGRANMMRP